MVKGKPGRRIRGGEFQGLGREVQMGMAWEIPGRDGFKSNDCASSELLVTFFRPKDTGCGDAEWDQGARPADLPSILGT